MVASLIPTVVVRQRKDLPDALRRLGLPQGRPVMVLIGGAGGLFGREAAAAAGVIGEVIAPAAGELGAIVVDGGTDAGVMRMAGEARRAFDERFLLVGVVGRDLVDLSADADGSRAAAEPNHSHLVVVPGVAWGDETPWLFDVAQALAAGRPIQTVLINGGAIAHEELQESLRRRIPAIVIRGTGRYADELVAGGPPGGRDRRQPPSSPEYDGDLIKLADATDLEGLRVMLSAALRGVPWTRE